ncbi:band 4.1-like protein 3a isoform X4 [Oncorhynchus clarkii lewisi]|uniref:band 4.1-like protein 3a isoform X4 n=1 Tax=Oncorhynchus clarkii lewisi TaxID=490388 RepID=UPI0039B89B17
MTTEPNSESSADQQEASAVPLLEAESFPPAAAHSTPVRKKQKGERAEGGVVPQENQLEPSQVEEDRTSHRSSTSKLSRSPGGGRSVRSYKTMQCKVNLLDGSDYTCVVEKRERGHVLFHKVCEQLNLLEKDYFGITFRDIENQKNWLDPSKEMKKQIRGAWNMGVAWNFSFNVKFYPPDPAQLSEDITRYYLCLQLRDDVVSGRLPCSFATHTVLGSYTVQSELGDYDPEESGTDYVSEFRFAPNQTKELEEKVMDLHKNYKGMMPAEAEMHFLENVKKLSMYGVDLHHAKDSEGVEIMLGVCSSGLLIYRDRLRINRFAWPKVLKISYKRNNFYIKIRPGEFEQFESTIGFKLPNHRAAKRLWKVCVEHHTFFRLVSPETPPKKFLNLGSKFRYSGRTQAQTRRASSQIVRPAPCFERSTSKRYIMSRSLDGAPQSTPKRSTPKRSTPNRSSPKRSSPQKTVSPRIKPPASLNGTKPTEMGSDLYGRAKGIAVSDLITTVTPEKKVEERKAEEEVEVEVQVEVEEEDETTKATEMSQPSPTSPIRHDTKNSFIRRIKGENVFVRHSVLMLEDTVGTPEELLKHATNISELKRSFLETGADTAGLTEWEKRLSSSPLRSLRLDEAPMIEPLELDEVPSKEDEREDERVMAAGGSIEEEINHSPVDTKTTVPKPTFEEMSPELTALLHSARYQTSTRGWTASPAHSQALLKTTEKVERIVLQTEVVSSQQTEEVEDQPKEQPAEDQEQPVEKQPDDRPDDMEKQAGQQPEQVETDSLGGIKDDGPQSVLGFTGTLMHDDSDTPSEASDTSGAASIASAGPALTAAAQAAVDEAVGAAVNQTETEEKTPTAGSGGGLGLDSPSEGEVSTRSVSEEEEEEKENSLDWRGRFVSPSPTGASWQSLSGEVAAARAHSETSALESPEVLTFNRADVMEETEMLVPQDVPVIHTEMKTITYRSLEGDADTDPEAGVLMSAQTITSETTSTTTTTHITKTVKGGISETRIEKRIVISGDADIDHDEALAQAIKEAKEQHPDMSVTKVVVHKETEITPEEGEE